VLELSIAQALFERFPDFPEGELTRIRANVVSRSSCADVGRRLGERLRAPGTRLGPDDQLARLAANSNVLSALVEAALGALYLAYGFERIRAPIVDAFSERLEYALTTHVDYKTELQEVLAQLGRQVTYSVVEISGPPHERRFTCAAVIDAEIAGVGTGPSKKAAEQIAARETLAVLKQEE
jgi:ribonuclease III